MKHPIVAPMLGALVSTFAIGAHAADFYVDPATGSSANDGSQQKPWKTLEEVVSAGHFGKAVKAGDTVHLLGGYHGEMLVSGGSYSPPITVAAVAGQTAKLRRARFGNTSGWILRGVSVSPSYGTATGTVTMVEVQTSASKVTVEDSELFSVADSSAWGVPEWLNAASNGISLRGAESVARNNKVKNVRFGITADASKVMVEGNTVENFSADGLRGLGDDETFQYNVVKNSYLDGSVDANHDDGFQSWSVGSGGVGTGEVKNMVLRGNVIIDAVDPNQKLKGTLQGIGCFDGMFAGWVVENNVIITNHWHGISLYGAKDSRIVNNTVIDVNTEKPGPPWIMVNNHKNGTPSQNVIVRNNLATAFNVKGTNVVQDHNTTLAAGDLVTHFVAPTAPIWDVRLLKTAPAVDKGSTEQAPALDADKIPRPQGAGFDLGAYEWHDGSVTPSGGGTGGGSGGGASGGSAGSGANGGSAGGGAAGGGAGAGGGSAGGGAGGSAGGGAGGAGTGAKGGKAESGDDGGCGCRVSGAPVGGAAGLALLSLGALLLAGRRRRGG
jgi:parallel beta-helix repeat protein